MRRNLAAIMHDHASSSSASLGSTLYKAELLDRCSLLPSFPFLPFFLWMKRRRRRRTKTEQTTRREKKQTLGGGGGCGAYIKAL